MLIVSSPELRANVSLTDQLSSVLVDGDSSLYSQSQKQQQMMLKFGIRQILCKKPWIPYTPKYAVINLVAIGTSVLEKTILYFRYDYNK